MVLLALVVLVDPLGPVDLDLRVLGLLLGEAGPVLSFLVGFPDVEDDVPALGVPLGLVHLDEVKQDEVEPVVLTVSLR